jgi:hypothetical protein
MFRRITIVSTVCVAVLAFAGGTAAAKKKPKLKVGDYVGTTSNGIEMTMTLDPGRTSGAIYYCATTAPFTVTGKSFSVLYQDPVSLETINANGRFKVKKRSVNPRTGKIKWQSVVSGTIEPNGCDASPQTFALRHP